MSKMDQLRNLSESVLNEADVKWTPKDLIRAMSDAWGEQTGRPFGAGPGFSRRITDTVVVEFKRWDVTIKASVSGNKGSVTLTTNRNSEENDPDLKNKPKTKSFSVDLSGISPETIGSEVHPKMDKFTSEAMTWASNADPRS